MKPSPQRIHRLRRGRTVTVRELRRLLRASRKAPDPAVIVSGPPRPRSRGECREEPRPCPWISCRYHLYLDVSPRTGSLRLNFPDLEVWELEETCALDVAERGGTTLDRVGRLLDLTRERVRQLERLALVRLGRAWASRTGEEEEEEEAVL
ncbi:MAG: sigma factor-like helix-turn-helix DNA-binding protein [Deltaproteobacteria bacterium]|nr:sigma factor-like helix-turn-helix DNA-binding protein [Deltaproteobacteria bacterium]